METLPKDKATDGPNPVPAGAPGRAATTVLGWIEGVSIMVTKPQNASGRLRLLEGEIVPVRVFTGKSAFAFRASVLKAAHLPSQYFHLSFPSKFETVEIRSSPRWRARLPAVISAAGTTVGQGNIVNIGTTGALIETVEALD